MTDVCLDKGGQLGMIKCFKQNKIIELGGLLVFIFV